MTAIPATDNNPAFVRLHIAPLDPDLLTAVLSATLRPKARNISYHTLETFPEKRYGYLELPAEDAEKLRNKLHGAILKGSKIRVEKAKPERIPEPLGEEALAMGKSKEKRDKDEKKRKREVEVEGMMLEEGRKVKRGWTEVGDVKDKKARRERKEREKGEKKKRVKSKYTDHEECLVKTVLPAKAAGGGDEEGGSKKKRKGREVVVHEFEKTTKFPTFLKAAAATEKTKALEFVEGKGWVDEEGNVVDGSKTKSKPPPRAVAVVESKPKEESDESSDSGSSDESSDDEEESVEAAATPEPVSAEEPQSAASSPSVSRSDPARPKSSSSTRNLTIQIPPATPPKDAKVHPLEALYKRSAPADGEEAPKPSDGNTFSFFGAAGNEDINEEMEDAQESHAPMTPFTRLDVENRGIRSAAPTPDTAHPGRRFQPWEPEEAGAAEDEDEEDLDEDEGDASALGEADAPGNSEAPTSDFQKWFWENRGNINRSWRKRRKEVGKEKRYRENKARMARAI